MIEGEGSLTGDGNVKVGGETYEAGAVVLATGSVALAIPGVEFGGRVVDTWGAWSLPEQPKRIAVVGAGASGAEIASAYGRFGTEVILIEMLDQILPAEDKDMAQGRRARLQEAEHHDLDRHQGGERRGRQELGEGEVRRYRGRGRLPVHRRRPGARHRGAEPGRGRGRDRGEREDQGRRVPAHLEPQDLRDRRPGGPEGARAQGVRGGRRGGRSTPPASRPTPSTRTWSPAPPSASRRSRASE